MLKVEKDRHKQPFRRHKKRRQKHRSWDEDDVSELVYNRRYQAWAERNAREAEEEDAAATGGAEGAASKQACAELIPACVADRCYAAIQCYEAQLRSQLQAL